MPKMEPHRGLVKRVKQTGPGELKGSHTYASHRFHGKTRKQKHHLRKPGTIHSIDCKCIREMLVK